MTTLTYHTCSPWILGLHTLPIFLFLLISYYLPEKLALSVLLPGKKSYLIFQYKLKCCILHNVLIHFFNLEYMPLLCFHVAKFLVPALQTMTIRDVNDFLKGWFISSMLQPSFVVVFFVTASMCSDDIIYMHKYFLFWILSLLNIRSSFFLLFCFLLIMQAINVSGGKALQTQRHNCIHNQSVTQVS